MTTTWGDLLDDVMILTESVGASDIEEVAKIYLMRTLKYISRKADLTGLVGVATAVYDDTFAYIPIGTGGFEITDFQTPFQLLVGNDSDTEVPTPYHALAYKDWLNLRGSSTGDRYGVNSVLADNRYDHSFTVNDSNQIEMSPLPADDTTVTFRYFKAPTPFGDGTGVPPLVEDWTDMLVDGAVLLTRAYITNPGGERIDTYKILSALDEQIMQMKINLEGRGFRRTQIRISNRYVPGGRRGYRELI